MLPDIKLAVRLQDIDNRVAEVTREVSSLPKHIAEIERKLESHERKLEADRAALTANLKDRKRLEGDIQVQQQKISKLKDQMLEAKTNEQYRAFQHEIEFCEKEIRQAERKSIATQISPAVLSAYERVRKLRHGIALAEAVDGRCSQCHMSLRLQFFQDLKRGEQVMHCESCSRILYYNPPESFEHL